MTTKNSMVEIHEKCYTELYPKERLLMLTPDSPNDLEYNFNDIYIVGGIVDRGHEQPLTMSKAKRLGLRTARLPLPGYGLHRTNCLHMNKVVDILLARQFSKDWKAILDEHLPKNIPREYRKDPDMRHTWSMKGNKSSSDE